MFVQHRIGVRFSEGKDPRGGAPILAPKYECVLHYAQPHPGPGFVQTEKKLSKRAWRLQSVRSDLSIVSNKGSL